MASAIEVADIFRRHGEAYRQAQLATIWRAHGRRRTPDHECHRGVPDGGARRPCRGVRGLHIHAHCLQLLPQPPLPKCQNLARAEWLAARQAELLPVPYFHIVFTLPAPLAAIAFHNKAVVYSILMCSAAAALRTLAADPKHLGAAIGVIAVPHTS